MLNPKVILLLFGAVALATCGVIDQDDKADGVDEDNDNESNVKCVLLFYFRIFFCFVLMESRPFTSDISGQGRRLLIFWTNMPIFTYTFY